MSLDVPVCINHWMCVFQMSVITGLPGMEGLLAFVHVSLMNNKLFCLIDAGFYVVEFTSDQLDR